jgi:peroxiredoxin Q/BCP
MIKTGDKAPDFELPDHDGNPVRLSSLRGRPVVLYFYPKAGTRGRISLCLPPRSAER